jgi:hypothetical protein
MSRTFLIPAAFVLQAAAARADDRVDFAHDILPLLKARCAECHSSGKYKGGVSFDTREALITSGAVIAGKSADSPLIERVSAADKSRRMPAKGEALSAREVALLRAWIDQGLPWQEGFSFAKATYAPPLKPRRPVLPPAEEGVTNPVDRIVAAYYRGHPIIAPAPLGDAAFLRRVYLDVIGLLPTPDQLDAFLAEQAPGKRARLVRRLLDDRRAYAEHWLTFWNDLLRNDYVGTGYIDGGRRPITAWLYRALRDNKPFDQFVRELISPSRDSEGFIKGITWRGNVNASQVPELQFAQNVAQVFLGVNLKCASCHDSFIDHWKLADAYGMAAVVSEEPPEMYRCDKPIGVRAQAKFLFPELGAIDASRPKAERLEKLAALMTHPANGRPARTIVNRIWQRLMGRGLVHPVDVMANEPWSADLLDFLAADLADHGYDLQRTIERIVTSRAYQSQCAQPDGDAADYVFRGPIAKRMTAEQFVDAVWRLTDTAPVNPVADFGDRAGEPVRAALVVADPLQRSLGRPNRDQVVTTRPEDLSTLQALDLSNGQPLADLLDRGARNFRARHPHWNPNEMAVWVYRAALCRRPTATEAETARQLLGTTMTDEGLSDLLWAVVMLPEFQMIR